MKVTNIEDRIKSVRSMLKREGLSGWIFKDSDPHIGEYVAEYSKVRTWVSGFTGSMGVAVVTNERAALWSDFRYYIQAGKELEGTEFLFYKSDNPTSPTLAEWLAESLNRGDTVGIDGSTVAWSEAEEIEKSLSACRVTLALYDDLIAPLWSDRPALPSQPLFLHAKEFVSASVEEKVEKVRAVMRRKGCTYYPVSTLDAIAWLYNLRGSDISYNPLFLSHTIIGEKSLQLFIDSKKIEKREVEEHLSRLNVEILPYNSFEKTLRELPEQSTLSIDKGKLAVSIRDALPKQAAIHFDDDIITDLKAIKSEREQHGFRAAVERDGAALASFIYQLEQREERFNEVTAAERLTRCRKERGSLGDSFSTISALNGNGALCHYRPSKESCPYLDFEEGNLYLIDSGGHYPDGTTDITRTIALGTPTKQQIFDYTLVLKGHIALSRAIFPAGSKGYQLDTVARQPLWQHMIDYGHGTGHGVGYFLNVHEGPQGISPRPNNVALEPGMVLANEPGIYREDSYGVRIENLLLVEEYQESEFGPFLSFETVTLFPYDKSLIDKKQLTVDEVEWVDKYHKRVFERLSPYLSPPEKEWLKGQCRQL